MKIASNNCFLIARSDMSITLDEIYSSVIREKGESQNGGNKQKKHAESFKNGYFSTPWYARTGAGCKKCLFFGKFGVLCFIVTSVLIFSLLLYYRRIYNYSHQEYFNSTKFWNIKFRNLAVYRGKDLKLNISCWNFFSSYSQLQPICLHDAYGKKYSSMDQVKVFKDCLPQILLGTFLNTLSHIDILLVLCYGKSLQFLLNTKFHWLFIITTMKLVFQNVFLSVRSKHRCKTVSDVEAMILEHDGGLNTGNHSKYLSNFK